MSTRSARKRPCASIAISAVVTLSRPCASPTKCSDAVRQPAHGPAEPLGRLQNERIFAIDKGLGAEPAADVLRDHAKFVARRYSGCRGDHVCMAVDALTADGQGERGPSLGVVFADGAARGSM